MASPKVHPGTCWLPYYLTGGRRSGSSNQRIRARLGFEWEQVEITETRTEKYNGDLTKRQGRMSEPKRTGREGRNRKHCRNCHQYPTMPKTNTLRYQTFKECTIQEMTVGWRKLRVSEHEKKYCFKFVNLKILEKLSYLAWPKEHIFVKSSIHLLYSYSMNAYEGLSRQA